MKIFIDTANVGEIREAQKLGILDGVTTNPSLIAKEGRSFIDLVKEICSIVSGPVSVEVTSTRFEEMIVEARSHASLAENVVVKIPLIKEGLKAIKKLGEEGIKTNATLVFSPSQALLAAKAGATYVSPFIGRLDDISHFGMDIVRDMKQIFLNYDFETRIIVASIRHPLHVVEAALAGADVATIPFNVIERLLEHPLTEKGQERFLKDWEKVPKK